MEDYATLCNTSLLDTTGTATGLPLILDGTFFHIIAEEGLKVTGQCTLCPSKIMGLKTTTSNFNTHLKKMHPDRHRLYEEYKIERGQTIKKRRTSHDVKGILSTNPKRQFNPTDATSNQNGITSDVNDDPSKILDDRRRQSGSGLLSTNPGFRPVPRRPPNPLAKPGSISAASLPPTIKARRKETDDIVFNFIIKSLSPPSLVESPHFTSLVAGLCANPRRVMSRSTLESRINMQSLVKRSKIVRNLGNTEVICVTVDAWTVASEPTNTFIAMTAHWIGPALKVQSALLSCQRFQMDLTFNGLIDIIYEVLAVYDIPSEKIGCIVTNNASNLLPTRIYQLQRFEGEAEATSDGLENYLSQYGHGDTVTNEDLSFYNIGDILTEAKESGESPYDFPSHYDCPTQTLVGVLATSTFETLSNPDHPMSYIFQSAIEKCQGLWRACSNKEAGERIQEVYGLEILIPNRLNWGSYLEAIDCLLGGRDALEGIFLFFELPALDDKELEFLEEYMKTMDPMTDALNLLQDVYSDSYMGSFVPTILSVKEKLEELRFTNLKYTEPLVESLLAGLNGPFLDIITLDERARPLILASILHPLYKLSWIPIDKVEELKGWYLEEAGNFGRVVESNSCKSSLGSKKVEDPVQDTSEADKFLDNYIGNGEGDNGDTKEDISSILVEFLDYLDAPVEPADGGQLDLFPNVKKLFITFNTAIASSVLVEKIITFSEVSFAPSNAILTNEMLEKMLILKCNYLTF